DTIGALAGLDTAASERIRGHRPGVTEAAEASLHALFDVGHEDEAPGLARATRLLAAARAAHLDGAPELAEFYTEQLGEEPAVTSGPAAFDAAVLCELVRGGADSAAARAAQRSIRAL